MFTLFDQEEETRLYHKEIADEARAEGHAKGIVEGIAKGLVTSVSALMKAQNLSVDEAMRILSIPDDQQEQIAKMLTHA